MEIQLSLVSHVFFDVNICCMFFSVSDSMGRKCKTCQRPMPKWDFHEECLGCRKTFDPHSFCNGNVSRRCGVCKEQTDNDRSLYENKAEEYLQGKGSPVDRQPQAGESKTPQQEELLYHDRVEKVTSLSMTDPPPPQPSPPSISQAQPEVTEPRRTQEDVELRAMELSQQWFQNLMAQFTRTYPGPTLPSPGTLNLTSSLPTTSVAGPQRGQATTSVSAQPAAPVLSLGPSFPETETARPNNTQDVYLPVSGRAAAAETTTKVQPRTPWTQLAYQDDATAGDRGRTRERTPRPSHSTSLPRDQVPFQASLEYEPRPRMRSMERSASVGCPLWLMSRLARRQWAQTAGLTAKAKQTQRGTHL